jgi:5-(carboxyamino)imidazole ribonucleotide mutase
MSTTTKPLVGILMGSDSDWPTMKAAAEALTGLGIASEVNVMSAHRTPDDVAEYTRTAESRGLKVIIAGAGGAAHLGGVVASMTILPVIGVPIETKCSGGLDSLLSIVQMPSGVPVACVAIGGARNAGILAAQIIATGDAELRSRLVKFKAKMADDVRAKNQALKKNL